VSASFFLWSVGLVRTFSLRAPCVVCRLRRALHRKPKSRKGKKKKKKKKGKRKKIFFPVSLSGLLRALCGGAHVGRGEAVRDAALGASGDCVREGDEFFPFFALCFFFP
jgi:hypothetical protein